MTNSYRDTVRAAYERIESEEIQARLRAGTLTEEAREVAEQVLVARGEHAASTVDAAPPVPGANKPSRARYDLAFSVLSFVLLVVAIRMKLNFLVAILLFATGAILLNRFLGQTVGKWIAKRLASAEQEAIERKKRNRF